MKRQDLNSIHTKKTSSWKSAVIMTVLVTGITGLISKTTDGWGYALFDLLASSAQAEPAATPPVITAEPMKISCEQFSPKELGEARGIMEMDLPWENPDDSTGTNNQKQYIMQAYGQSFLDKLMAVYNGTLDREGNLFLRKAVLQTGILGNVFSQPKTAFNLSAFTQLNSGKVAALTDTTPIPIIDGVAQKWLSLLGTPQLYTFMYDALILGKGTLDACKGNPDCAFKFDANTGSYEDMIAFLKYLKSIDLATCPAVTGTTPVCPEAVICPPTPECPPATVCPAAPVCPACPSPAPGATATQTPAEEGKMCYCKDDSSAACKWRKRAAPAQTK